jgi:hypothetical protein
LNNATDAADGIIPLAWKDSKKPNFVAGSRERLMYERSRHFRPKTSNEMYILASTTD